MPQTRRLLLRGLQSHLFCVEVYYCSQYAYSIDFLLVVLLILHVLFNNRGNNSSVLHYGHAGAPNDKTILDGDMWWAFRAVCLGGNCSWISSDVLSPAVCLTWVGSTTVTPQTSPAPSQPMASSLQTREPFMKLSSNLPELWWLPSNQVIVSSSLITRVFKRWRRRGLANNGMFW